jgi:hypothetical protein
MSNFKDLSGQTFYRLTVIPNSNIRKNNCTYWQCMCKCGTIKYIGSRALVTGRTQSCGCLHKEQNGDDLYKGTKDISGSYMYALHKGALRRNLEFTITIEYIQKLLEDQQYNCTISGINICGSRNPYGKNRSTYQNQTASLDRIDSHKGYISNNIQWVHKIVNYMKQDIDQKKFIRLAHLVTHPFTPIDNTHTFDKKILPNNWNGFGSLSASLLNNLRSNTNSKRCRNYHRQLSITTKDLWNQWVKQKGCCVYTGIPLLMPIKRKGGTISVDRIDSNVGYTINNIQLVYITINNMKQSLSDQEFRYWCKLISEYNV